MTLRSLADLRLHREADVVPSMTPDEYDPYVAPVQQCVWPSEAVMRDGLAALLANLMPGRTIATEWRTPDGRGRVDVAVLHFDWVKWIVEVKWDSDPYRGIPQLLRYARACRVMSPKLILAVHDKWNVADLRAHATPLGISVWSVKPTYPRRAGAA